MKTKILLRTMPLSALALAAVAVATSLPFVCNAEENDDLFRITAQDDRQLSQEFIDDIIKTLGKKAASHASLELHYCYIYGISDLNRECSYQDNSVYYINYLERLYERACKRLTAKMSHAEKQQFEQAEKEWREKGCPVFGENTPQPEWLTAPIGEQRIRFLRNRTAYLECSPEQRRAVDKINKLSVRYANGNLPIRFCELQRVTPVDIEKDDGRTYIECIATLPPDFCHEVKIGNDEYLIGMLIPTNDVASETSTHGYERNLCIWKNGMFHAVHQLPPHCTILSVMSHGADVDVKFVQWSFDEVYCQKRDWRKRKTQTFTIDFTLQVFAPVKITNWLNYFMDSLGNIHKPDCCKNCFGKKSERLL